MNDNIKIKWEELKAELKAEFMDWLSLHKVCIYTYTVTVILFVIALLMVSK